jgi:DNA ligase 3
MNTIKEGLEGLVLKDVKSIYEPGKRHWLKMKKDYLDSGSMADTADLVCLGAYYGTGNKGGLMSVFLMGVYNEKKDCWQTVTKVGNGFDDKTLDKLQKELDMIEINKNQTKVPDWLDVNRSLIPDFVVKNPKKAPVWEITGAEFSNSDVHTAAGISIRFPRVTKIRDDKTWKEATDVERLKTLFKISKEKSDIDVKSSKLTASNFNDDEDEEEEPVAKKPQKRSSNEVQSNNHKKAKKEIESELPSIYQDNLIYLPINCENYDKLKRYIVA